MSDALRPAEQWMPIDVDELDYLPFDFERLLVDGETISSATSTLEAISGADEDADSRRVGGPEIASGATAGRQWVEGVLAGVTYLLRVVGTTSDAGRRVVIAGVFKGVRVS